MASFDFDWCYLVVDQHGYTSIRDSIDGLEIAEMDSVQEAIEFLAQLEG